MSGKNQIMPSDNSMTYHAVPEIIDPVFVKTSPICSFSMTEIKRFGLVFTKRGSINLGTGDNHIMPNENSMACQVTIG
jgi:hypothetical protein